MCRYVYYGCFLLALSISLCPLQAQAERPALSAKGEMTKGSDRTNVSALLQRASAGDLEAQFKLGLYYHHTKDGNRSERKSIDWVTKSAEGGYAKAQYYLAWTLFDSHYPEDFISWMSRAARQGLVEAQYDLGRYYVSSDHLYDDDWEKAVSWFLKAAERGHAQSQYQLGKCFLDSRLPEEKQDPKQALFWFEKSAKAGALEGMFALGELYEDVFEEYHEGVKWYQKAASLGYPPAQLALAYCYRDGRGVPQNYQLAYNWSRKADQAGYTEATPLYVAMSGKLARLEDGQRPRRGRR